MSMKHPASLSKLDYSVISRKRDNSVSTGITQSYANLHSDRSQVSLASPYKDTTFGTSRRMYLPPSQKFDFLDPESTLDRKHGFVSKTPRKIQPTDVGLDSPSFINYDPMYSLEALKPKKDQYSFPASTREARIMVPEVGLPYPLISFSPGPGVYSPRLKEVGSGGPKYSIDKQKAGYSYLPPIDVMEYPPSNKYDPKPTYLKRSLINDGLGVVRAAREYTYIFDPKTPGPGIYNTKDDLFVPINVTYATLDRAPRDTSLVSKARVPGPGEYNLLKRPFERHNWDQMRNKAVNYREQRKGKSAFGN